MNSNYIAYRGARKYALSKRLPLPALHVCREREREILNHKVMNDGLLETPQRTSVVNI
jgi:hypothetical protein